MVAPGEPLGIVAPHGRAGGHEHEDGATAGASHGVVDPRQRLLVGPLRVFDGQRDRGLFREPHQDVGEGDPKRVARAPSVVDQRERFVGDQASDSSATPGERHRDAPLFDKASGRLERVFELRRLGQSNEPARHVGDDAEGVALGERLASGQDDPWGRRVQEAIH